MNASPGKSLSSVSIPKATVGPSRRNEQSPRQQPRVGGRGSGSGMLSPSSQGAKLSSRSVHRHNDTSNQDFDAPVPKFGDWDESDPGSAENLTQKFKIVREAKENEKNTPVLVTPSPKFNTRNKDNQISKKAWCLPSNWKGCLCLGHT